MTASSNLKVGSDQALRTGSEGATSRERLGVGRISPRDREVGGILQQPPQSGATHPVGPVGFPAQGSVRRGRGGLK